MFYYYVENVHVELNPETSQRRSVKEILKSKWKMHNSRHPAYLKSKMGSFSVTFWVPTLEKTLTKILDSKIIIMLSNNSEVWAAIAQKISNLRDEIKILVIRIPEEMVR